MAKDSNSLDIRMTKNFRVCNAINVFRGKISAKEELAIEKRCRDAYFVVAFVEYDKREDSVTLCPVGDRLTDLDANEFLEFKDNYNVAKEIILASNKKYGDDDDDEYDKYDEYDNDEIFGDYE